MSTFGGPVLVDGPVPQPLRFNLLTVATPFSSPDEDGVAERWAQGAAVWPYSPDLPGGQDPCAAGTLRVKGSGTSPDIQRFAAFTAYIAESCNPATVNGDQQGYINRAIAALAGTEAYAAEKQLISGTYLPSNPWVCDLNCTILTGAAVSGGAALELLENAIAETARRGVIHADPATVTAWSRDFYVFREGQTLITANGTPVVSGAGYVGSHPIAQAAPGTRKAWAYVTGPVVYQRSSSIIQLPERIDQALDRETNLITYRAERDYLVAWDGQLQAAALIDRAL